MRKILFTLGGFLFLLSSQAQGYDSCEGIKLETKVVFTPEVEKTVLLSCQRLLSTPMEKQNLTWLKSAPLLIGSMSGMPTFTFEIGETAGKISTSNEDSLVIYLAAMIQYCLAHPQLSRDPKLVQLQSVTGVLAYCHSQQLQLTGELKRLQAAQQKGASDMYKSK